MTDDKKVLLPHFSSPSSRTVIVISSIEKRMAYDKNTNLPLFHGDLYRVIPCVDSAVIALFDVE